MIGKSKFYGVILIINMLKDNAIESIKYDLNFIEQRVDFCKWNILDLWIWKETSNIQISSKIITNMNPLFYKEMNWFYQKHIDLIYASITI